MKFKSMILVAALAALGFTACEPEEKDLGAPAATLSTQTIALPQAGGTATFDVSATRDWTISTDADWIGYNPTSGKASEASTTITITATANTEYERTGELLFEVGEGLITKVITVTQPGLKVKEVHTGEVDSPYNVEEALEIIANGTYTENDVYVKGIISSIDTEKDYPGNSFGNATYWISDDGTNAVQLEVYRGYGLGGEKMKSSDYIKVGDEVIVCGKLVLFKSTPEITQGSKIYSLNGQTAGEPVDAVETTVAEFISKADTENPYRLTGTVSRFNSQYCSFDLTDATGTIYVYSVANKSEWSSKIKNGGTVTLTGYYEYYAQKSQHEVVNATIESFTAGGDTPGGDTGKVETVTIAEFNAAEDSDSQKYQLTGTVSNISNTTYGNFDLVDASGSVYVYGLTKTELPYPNANGKADNDKSFAEIGLKEGDVLTLIGYKTTFNDKVEVIGGYYVSHTSGGDTPSDPGTPSGDGTAANPFNVAGVLAYTTALGADVTSTEQVYAKGKISGVKFFYDAEHHTATYNISDDGSHNNEFTVYGSYYFDNKEWVEGNKQIKVGDEVIVCGNVVNYKGTTPEFANKQNWLVSLNGATSDDGSGDDPGDEPGGDVPEGDVSFDLNSSAQSWSEETDATYGAGFSATTSGVKTGYYKYNSSTAPVAPSGDHIRIYKKSAFVVTAPEGKTISKLVITATDAGKCVDMAEVGDNATAKADTDAVTITWAGTAKNQVVLYAEAAQVRAKSIAVEYTK